MLSGRLSRCKIQSRVSLVGVLGEMFNTFSFLMVGNVLTHVEVYFYIRATNLYIFPFEFQEKKIVHPLNKPSALDVRIGQSEVGSRD